MQHNRVHALGKSRLLKNPDIYYIIDCMHLEDVFIQIDIAWYNSFEAKHNHVLGVASAVLYCLSYS